MKALPYITAIGFVAIAIALAFHGRYSVTTWTGSPLRTDHWTGRVWMCTSFIEGWKLVPESGQ